MLTKASPEPLIVPMELRMFNPAPVEVTLGDGFALRVLDGATKRLLSAFTLSVPTRLPPRTATRVTLLGDFDGLASSSWSVHDSAALLCLLTRRSVPPSQNGTTPSGPGDEGGHERNTTSCPPSPLTSGLQVEATLDWRALGYRLLLLPAALVLDIAPSWRCSLGAT